MSASSPNPDDRTLEQLLIEARQLISNSKDLARRLAEITEQLNRSQGGSQTFQQQQQPPPDGDEA